MAEILVLAQFSPRSVGRAPARASAQDALALTLTRELVDNVHGRSLPMAQRVFACMPNMHSESALIH